ncbi:hypothetical protein N9597_02915 [Candidatus Marinimicrobia bacterium]|nr:hypothetical protein [Candidatus Neomarinimicrobiota bacterium]
MKNCLLILLFTFYYSIGNNESWLSNINTSYSGYTNLYGINRIEDGSIIKLPFRLLSHDFNFNYKNFSIDTKWGLEHKIKYLDSGQSLNNFFYDLISTNNVDYKGNFREYYLSFFPSYGEIKIGKQIHAWGAVDAISPIDILNPINYYYLFTDADETKIGRESLVIDLFFDKIKIELILMPNHVPNFIPSNDSNFPIVLPAIVKKYQFLNQFQKKGLAQHFMQSPIEYGGYIQRSFDNMDWTLYYFSGYDRNFNLYGANVFADQFDINTVTDTIFSYRKTEMYALSNVSFIGDFTLRSDFAYFNTNAGDKSIENRPYLGSDPISDFLDFSTNIASSYFNLSGQYYQYSIQLEHALPYDIDFTTQLFGYEELNIEAETIDIALTNFEIYLDGKNFFYPGMGSSLATLAKNGLLLNLNKSILDETIEFQLTNLLDTKDKGQLTQFQLTYNAIDNLSLSLLYYKGKGNKKKYSDIISTDIDESLIYPFNAMENFSHIRVQIQYFF